MSQKLTNEVVSDSPELKSKIASATATLQAGRPATDIPETDILNFALNLEYLGAEFYTYASTGKSISAFGWDRWPIQQRDRIEIDIGWATAEGPKRFAAA